MPEVVAGLPSLVQVALRPHRDVHQVRVVADRVAILGAASLQLAAADARSGTSVERPEDDDVVGLAGGHGARPLADYVAGRLPAVLEIERPAQPRQRQRRGQGTAANAVVEHHEAAHAVDLGSVKAGVREGGTGRFHGQVEHAAPGALAERRISHARDRRLAHAVPSQKFNCR